MPNFERENKIKLTSLCSASSYECLLECPSCLQNCWPWKETQNPPHRDPLVLLCSTRMQNRAWRLREARGSPVLPPPLWCHWWQRMSWIGKRVQNNAKEKMHLNFLETIHQGWRKQKLKEKTGQAKRLNSILYFTLVLFSQSNRAQTRGTTSHPPFCYLQNKSKEIITACVLLSMATPFLMARHCSTRQRCAWFISHLKNLPALKKTPTKQPCSLMPWHPWPQHYACQ